MSESYSVPRGVRLDSERLRHGLAAVGLQAHSYVANVALNHVFVDRRRALKVSVVESVSSKQLTEVVGDLGLWLRVRCLAEQIANDNTQETSRSGTISNGAAA